MIVAVCSSISFCQKSSKIFQQNLCLDIASLGTQGYCPALSPSLISLSLRSSPLVYTFVRCPCHPVLHPPMTGGQGSALGPQARWNMSSHIPTKSHSNISSYILAALSKQLTSIGIHFSYIPFMSIKSFLVVHNQFSRKVSGATIVHCKVSTMGAILAINNDPYDRLWRMIDLRTSELRALRDDGHIKFDRYTQRFENNVIG